jgi:ribose 5-phosphate isomerase RpiB
MTLTKADLSEILFDRVGLNKREAKDMVEVFLNTAFEGGRHANRVAKIPC